MKVAIPLFTTLMLFAPIAVAAQEQESDQARSGLFVAPVLKVTEVIDQTASFLGVRTGLVYGERLAFGVGAYMMVHRLDAPFLEDPIKQLGYAGLEVEYTAWATKPLHVSAVFLFGVGRRWRDQNNSDHDEIFVYEPAVNAEFKLGGPFQGQIGAGYRFVTRVTSDDTDNGDLSAPFGVVALKLGPF